MECDELTSRSGRCADQLRRPIPSAYRHWRLDVDGPVATLVDGRHARRRAARRLRAEAQLYDLGVDIELYDAVQRLRFEHPEVKAVVVTGGLDKVFCAGANIQMLAGSTHGHKVNFCKFTNETRNGIEDATAHSRPDVDRRGQRHRGRRRLRAGAGVRRDPARRRPGLGRVAARGAAARRAARHRRAHPGRRQAPRPPRPRRRVRHPRRGRQGPAGASTGASSTPSPRAAGSTSSCASGRSSGRAASDRPDATARRRAHPARAARSTATRSRYDHVDGRRSTATLGAAHDHRRRPDRRRSRRRPTSCSPPAPRRGCWRPPASSTTPSCACGSTSPSSARGCCAPTATPTPSPPPRTVLAPTPTTGWSARSACSGRAR